ncbi:Hypothetical Protein FCC1311_029792 [Hondaea fermentalgiana]|uniref:UDENN domain-containing protein n=1 Tax=Hondaea fermentalgiana TaxID=2315210 RepID=A0A2R5GAI6_9STRA|nr:Hypothetical Protein FCC1311_029792 [Hondaea fermentalgiana]|eukprot:GBG26758.1 Hypothetical Protein FCC1311_029792 [Hondaea fermentalgiana]
MLRENGRRWKRKYEQEKAVNKELGKRSKRWRAQSEVLENEIKDLEEKLSAQAALLERVSPVSTLHSPQPWWSTTPDSTARNSAADSPQLSTPLVALRTVDEEGLIESVGPEQVGSDTTPSNSPLRVNVDRSPPPENTQLTRCELFTHVITIDKSKELTSCWPLSARSSVPPNVEQFCFLAGSVATPASFVFMLSGECSTPLTRGFSCLDNATYGICLSDGTTCECILTKKPLFRLLEQVLRAMYGLGEDDRSAFLSALTESAAKVNVAHIGPGWKFTAVDDQVRWMWPERCATRLDLFVEWGLPTLLETMPLDQLLFLVGCLLLELKVVLVSSDLRRVTSAAFALLPFLRPCAWVQPFIPLLPPSLSVVCDAPVPVLVGAAEVPSEVRDIDGSMHSPCRDNGRQEAVVVRLDQGRLDLSEALSTSYHALKLPGLSELYLATRDVEDPTVLLSLVQDHRGSKVLREISHALVTEIRTDYPGLGWLDLSEHQIAVVENLELLPTLIILDLAGNQIGSFDVRSVECLRALETLNLARNHIQVVSGGQFPINPSLRKVDLSFNAIADLREENEHIQEARRAMERERAAMAEERALVTQVLQQLEAVRAQQEVQRPGQRRAQSYVQDVVGPDEESQASLGNETSVIVSASKRPTTEIAVGTSPREARASAQTWTVDHHNASVQTQDTFQLETLRLQNAVAEATASAEAAKHRANELEAKLHESQCELSDWKERLRESEGALKQMRKENATLTLQAQRKGFREESRLEALEGLLVAQERAIVNSRERGEDASADTLVAAWREKVFALLIQDRAARLEAKRTGTRHTQELEELRKELEASQQTCERLRRERDTSVAQARGLERSCHEATMTSQRRMTEVFRAKETMLAVAAKVDGDTVTLGAVLNRVKRYEDRLQLLPLKLRELALRVADAKDAWRRERAARTAAEKEIARAFEKMADLSEKLSVARNHLAEKSARVDSLECRIVELEQTLARTQSEAEKNLRATIEDMEAKSSEQHKELEDTRAALEAELSSARVCVKQQERELARLVDEAAREEASRVAFLEDRLRRKDTEVQNLRRERNALLGTLRDAERRGLLPGLGLAAPIKRPQVASESEVENGATSLTENARPSRPEGTQEERRPVESAAMSASILGLLDDADAASASASDDDDEDRILEMLLGQAMADGRGA